MNNKTPRCSDYQIALEMKLYAATPSISDIQLDGHLAKCHECAAYQEVSAEIHPLTAIPEPEVDFQGLHQRVVKVFRRKKLEFWFFLPLAYAAIFGISLYFADFVMMLMMLIFTAPIMLSIISGYRGFRGIDNLHGDDLISMARSQLRKEARILRLTSLGIPALFFLGDTLSPTIGNDHISLPIKVIAFASMSGYLELMRRDLLAATKELV